MCCAGDGVDGVQVEQGPHHVFQVDEEGEVVKNAWEDCKAGCPGTNNTAVIGA